MPLLTDNDPLRALLARYPMAPIVHYDAHKTGGHKGIGGPWVCVDLKVAGKLEKFAIWKQTGDVHKLRDKGTVLLIKGENVETL